MIIEIEGAQFEAHFETVRSPLTCASFQAELPFSSSIVHVRWSGEAIWIPLGGKDFQVGFEDPTSYPAPGQILLYPGGLSETEILIAYGSVHFASKAGTLAGNHFATISSGLERLRDIGLSTLWDGRKKITFR